ncbi:MAG: DNA-3-methyladenine glycosylase family protein [Tepidanaerobacteraceae bacterium]|nr:DNA glycosylase [Thermoanaerobacterales bacterium]
MKIVCNDILPFNLKIITEGGQAFRWNSINDREYIGVVGNNVYRVKQHDDKLVIDSNAENPDIGYIKEYFDLYRDYEQIERELKNYEELIPAINYCSGYRILFQDPWETTVSFIISSNNSIRNIKRTIEKFCQLYGKPIEYQGEIFYTFPTPDRLAGLTEEELRQTKCGYRAKYIIGTSRMIVNGDVDFYGLKQLPTAETRKELLKFPGVGRKVADCIMLFSMRKFDAFPIDVWIKRIIEHIYFEGNEKSLSSLYEFAEEKFKERAGFVQQYLFHYSRSLWTKIRR